MKRSVGLYERPTASEYVCLFFYSYGHRYTESCFSSLFLLMLQTCVGLFIQCLATGIIFVKISRPKGRSQTILFSDKAVICKRDGCYCLLFRVGDLRRSVIHTFVRDSISDSIIFHNIQLSVYITRWVFVLLADQLLFVAMNITCNVFEPVKYQSHAVPCSPMSQTRLRPVIVVRLMFQL